MGTAVDDSVKIQVEFEYKAAAVGQAQADLQKYSKAVADAKRALDGSRESFINLAKAMADYSRAKQLASQLASDFINGTEKMSARQRVLNEAIAGATQRMAAQSGIVGRFSYVFGSAAGASTLLVGAIAAIGAAAVGAGIAVGNMTTSLANQQEQLDLMSQELGVSQNLLITLQAAASNVGRSFEAVRPSIFIFSRNLASAAEGSEAAQKAFDKLKVPIFTKDGGLRDVESTFRAAVKALAEIPNEAERNRIAMQVFGRQARTIMAVFLQDLDEVERESRELGLALSQPMQEFARRADRAIDQTKLAMQGLSTQARSVFLPLGTVVEEIKAKIAVGLAQTFTIVLSNIQNSISQLANAMAPVTGVLENWVDASTAMTNAFNTIAVQGVGKVSEKTFDIGGTLLNAFKTAVEAKFGKENVEKLIKEILRQGTGGGYGVPGLSDLRLTITPPKVERERREELSSAGLKTKAVQDQIIALDELLAMGKIEIQQYSDGLSRLKMIASTKKEVAALQNIINELEKKEFVSSSVINEQRRLQANKDKIQKLNEAISIGAIELKQLETALVQMKGEAKTRSEVLALDRQIAEVRQKIYESSLPIGPGINSSGETEMWLQRFIAAQEMREEIEKTIDAEYERLSLGRTTLQMMDEALTKLLDQATNAEDILRIEREILRIRSDPRYSGPEFVERDWYDKDQEEKGDKEKTKQQREQETNKTLYAVADTVNAIGAFNNALKSGTQSTAAAIAQLIAALLAAAAQITGMSALGPAGAIVGAIAGLFMQQGGEIEAQRGVVVNGTRGFDSVRARLGRGEAVLSHDLTDQLKSFLNSERQLSSVRLNDRSSSRLENRLERAENDLGRLAETMLNRGRMNESNTQSSQPTLYMPVTVHGALDGRTAEKWVNHELMPRVMRSLQQANYRKQG